MSYKVKTYGEPLSTFQPVWVGVDQSYSGFAITMLNKHGDYFTQVAKFDGSGVQRLYDIKAFLESCFWNSDNRPYDKIKDVAIEGYAFGSQMAHMLGELGGLVKLTFYYDYDIKPLVVPPTSLKKYVTGKGTGVQKNQMLLGVYKKWGVEFDDDNAADSYALAKIASGAASLAYEKEVYSKLTGDEKFRA